ncbi:NAD(P)H-dependent oxidoreductase [Bisgaard Taxon 10/6]|uniref:NAD(P)H-dependent oxidoreductase n=1 Tax=Exercitatus varius TaxID=67857 RepID=UPI00294AF4A3|nr:NAD(P)H-dependent oxidoreductase [Exercitatus varius]MDG2956797.1 NAD(P)H-dependent oxidoreductase [Exercitatus varius]MDG2964930.1 NAD(P)H-dependent oxidoreductase [Exercitatus varius]
MATHLIIFAHPNPDSFTNAMVARVADVSAQQGAEVIVRDLYEMNFNPVLPLHELKGSIPPDILQEQQYIRRADLITLIYPLWWMGFPAILKGYLDRVLTHGFAYQTDETGSVGLLRGKKMQQFINLGSNAQTYRENGYAQGLDVCLVNGLFNFCGIMDIQHILFGSLYLIDDAARRAMLDETAEKTRNGLSQIG